MFVVGFGSAKVEDGDPIAWLADWALSAPSSFLSSLKLWNRWQGTPSTRTAEKLLGYLTLQLSMPITQDSIACLARRFRKALVDGVPCLVAVKPVVHKLNSGG